MRGTVALVANGSRARLYHVASDSIALLDIYEHPKSRLKESELGTDRPGRTYDEGPSGQRSTYEQPTGLHEVEVDAFARELAEAMERRLERQPDELEFVICAPPKLLGLVRSHLGQQAGRHLRETVPHDYTGMDEASVLGTLRGLGVKGTRANA